MKLLQLRLVICITFILISLIGCSIGRSARSTKEYRPNEWWNSQPSEIHICVYGIGDKPAEEDAFTEAKSNAINAAPAYVDMYVQGLLVVMMEQVSVKDQQSIDYIRNLGKKVSASRFSNIIPGKIETIFVYTKQSEYYRTFIQLLIPKSEIKRALVSSISMDSGYAGVLTNSNLFKDISEEIR